MATYQSAYTGSQIDAGINSSLIYTGYTSLISGNSGTITDAGLAAAISSFQPVQLNFSNWQGEGGAICRFLNDTVGGIIYGALDSDGGVGIITFTVSISTSTVTWSLVKPGLPYLTTAPTANNTDGLKFVVLSSEPATYYTGYYYIITGA